MKTQKEHIQVQVGAFLAIAVLLFMVATFLLGAKTSIFQTYYHLICYFDDISGLRVGGPVQLGGFNVGFIHAIEFEDRVVTEETLALTEKQNVSEEKPAKKIIVKIKVTLKIDKRYQDRIRSDSVASIVTQGLLGDRMIFITVGTPGRKKLIDGDLIVEVRPPTGFTHLVEKGDELMIDAKLLVQETTKLAQNLNTIADAVISGEGVAHGVIYDKKMGQAFEKITQVVDDFAVAGSNIADVAQKINKGDGTLGALVNDDSVFQSIKTLFGKANRSRLIRSVIRYTLQAKEKEQLQ